MVSLTRTVTADRRVTTRLEATVIKKTDFQLSALFARGSSLSQS